jgi:hypothetical protein
LGTDILDCKPAAWEQILSITNKIVIPTGANPDFLLRGTHQRSRVRLSVRKAA